MKNLKTIMAVCGLIVVMSSCQRGSGCPMGISEVNTQNERSCEMVFTKHAVKEIEVSE